MTRFTSKLVQTALLASGLFLFSACGGGNFTGDGIGSIDLAEYMPTENMDKAYKIMEKNSTTETNTTILNRITVSTVDGNTIVKTTEDRWMIKKSTITDINITTLDYIGFGVYSTTVTDKYVDIGDRIFGPCYADALIDTITYKGYTYDGDILKIKCFDENDISYSYLMRDIGVVAEIDEDCMSADGSDVDSSNIDTCPVDRIRYRYKFFNLPI